MNLGLLELVVLVTSTMRGRLGDPGRVAKFDKPAVKIMFQVTLIVRFLLECGLRFSSPESPG